MTAPIKNASEFGQAFDVSRETLERLTIFHDLLLKWNKRINLVSPNAETEIWNRHIADSAQLLPLLPTTEATLADFGSGAGFPGLILAALTQDRPKLLRVTLLESDARKGAFLAEAARHMGLQITVLTARVEGLPHLAADIITARALSPLEKLLEHYAKNRSNSGIGLFPKGETVHKELEVALRTWRFEHRLHRSITDEKAAIVEVGAIQRV